MRCFTEDAYDSLSRDPWRRACTPNDVRDGSIELEYLGTERLQCLACRLVDLCLLARDVELRVVVRPI